MKNIGATSILKRKTGVNNATILAMSVPHRAENLSYPSNFRMFDSYMFLLVLIMWMPIVYSTVYRIALEK
jgi:hypothetical protein